MRVLLISELFPTHENKVSGIFMHDQIEALKVFASVDVFNTNPWYRGKYLEIPGARFFDFHLFEKKPYSLLRPLLYNYWERKSIAVAKKITKPDIIHLHGSALRGRIALALSKYWNVPLVITEHTGPWSAISSRKYIFSRVKKALESADLVLPVSFHLKSEILNSGVRPIRMDVLGNPLNQNIYSLRQRSLIEKKKILFVGRLDEFKGALRSIKAFEIIMNSISDWELVVAGSGPEATQIKDHIIANGLEKRVHFIEKIFNRSELNKLFQSASYLVFPSRFESFGLVGAESLATGTPLLCTNQTGPLDYSNQQNSISINPDSIEEMSQGMLSMVNSIQRFEPKNIRTSILAKFGIASYSSQIQKHYKSLI